MTSAEFVDFTRISPGALLDVETKNRHYQIECLGGNAIRISGHPDLCPEPVAALLQGSSDKAGVLEPGLIGRGMYMRFLLDDCVPVTTSRVLRVQVESPKATPPKSVSIH
jgi:hypothetical protein